MKFCWTLAASLSLMAGVASAATIPVCGRFGDTTITTLAQYIADYGSSGCTVSDKTFSGFTYSSTNSGGGLAPSAAGITVIPQSSDPNDPGLEFQASWSVSEGQTVDSEIGFNVRVTNGMALIEDDTLSVPNFSVTSPGTASVTEDVCLGGTFVSGACTGGTEQSPKLIINGTGSDTLHVGPFGPYVSLQVLKDINLNGGSGTAPGSDASFSEVFQNFSEVPVPEPFSVLLLGTSLLAVAPILKKRLG